MTANTDLPIREWRSLYEFLTDSGNGGKDC